MDLKQYIDEIDRQIDLAEGIDEDNPAALEKKIELLVQAHVLLGELSGELYRLAKLYHVQRKKIYWDAYESAKGNKRMAADRATHEIAMREAECAGRARKYHNRFQSIEEEIHALKQKMRVHLADGSIGNYGSG